MFALRRKTDTEVRLALTREHEVVATPRRGEIAWDSFDPAAYPMGTLARAGEAWRERARQEYGSLALFAELASQVHLLGAPLDWSGAFARMIGDEVRHTEVCARFAEMLAPREAAMIDDRTLHPPICDGTTLRAHVRETVLAAFCIGETLSGRMFRRCLREATVPLARDIVRTIVDDETFHGELGWELLALLMRDDDASFSRERDALAHTLPSLFASYRQMCGAERGEAWARESDDDGDASNGANFGTLTARGYARCFYDGMHKDVVPGLVAVGFPEAASAWEAIAT